MERKIWIMLALLLFCLSALTVNVQSAKAQDVGDLSINPTGSDKTSFTSEGYPLYSITIHLWGNVTNIGTATIQFQPNTTLYYEWWYVHESCINSFIAMLNSSSQRVDNHPYWQMIRQEWVNYTIAFNWTVGMTETHDWDWDVGFRMDPFLSGNYYIIFYLSNFIDGNPHNNNPCYSESLWPGLYTIIKYIVIGPGVGGIVVPVDKFALLAPYIAASTTIIVAVAAVIYVKRVKQKKEKQ